MERDQLIYFIIAATVILIALTVFLLFVFIWYRSRRNKHILEKQAMQTAFEQSLLQSRLEMQEQTFNTISQEIHDNVGQLLSLAKVQLSIAEQNETTDKNLLAEIKNNIGNALTDLRDIAKSLNSGRLHHLTLTQAIEQELQRISRTSLFEVFFTTKGGERLIGEQRKTILFRILQELFQNILKHAQASEIVVTVVFEESELSIDISDNGIGFVPDEQNIKPGGLGLQNITARTGLMGGTANISSEPGRGTQITLHIPYAQ